MELDELKVIDFSKKIRFNKLNIFLSDVYTYFQNTYPSFISFFSGEIDSLSEEDILLFNKIKTNFRLLMESIETNKNKLNGLWEWEFVDFLDDLQHRFLLSRVLWKYFKTDRFGFSYSNGTQLQYTIPQGYTLERISYEVLGSPSSQDDWTDIAIRNNLQEKDYNTSGGNVIKLTISDQTANPIITTVMDSTRGKKVLGLDLNRNITFVSNDLSVLSYDGTFKQTVDILSGLAKGDIPQLPDLGRDRLTAGNSNNRGLGVNVMYSQIAKVFASDDSIGSLTILDIKFDSSDIYVSMLVEAVNSSNSTSANAVI